MSGKEATSYLSIAEQEKKELLEELYRLKRRPEGKIGYLLIGLGLFLIALAFIYSHNVAAFLGVAITFWGCLLLYIRPTQYIRQDILNATLWGQLKYIYSLMNELGFRGTPKYISPGTLRGISTATLYIPKSDDSQPPTDEQLSSDEIFLNNPSAIKIIPPGLGLQSLLESELKTNFSSVGLGYLQTNLEKGFVDGLEIAESFEMNIERSTVNVEVKGSTFSESLAELEGINELRIIGDPLIGSIACILARSTRRPVIIERVESDLKKRSFQIRYKIEEPSR